MMGFMTNFKGSTKGSENGILQASEHGAVEMSEKIPEPPLEPLMKSSSTSGSSTLLSAFSFKPSTTSARNITFTEEFKHEVVCNYLYKEQIIRQWINDPSGDHQGILVRKSPETYAAAPPALSLSRFARACAALNVQCAMTVNSRVVKTFFAWCPDAAGVPLNNGMRVQVLPSIDDLNRARKHHFAAFVSKEALLVVWDDEASNLMLRAKFIEDQLLDLVWTTGDTEAGEGPKKGPVVVELEIDDESGELKPEHRPTILINSIVVACTLLIITVLSSAGIRQLGIEILIDGSYVRLAFILLMPVQIFFTLFLCQVIVGCIIKFIGPMKQVHRNSRYYSARPPPRIKSGDLPHITIQCPVYKEGLATVIAPTVKSVKQAISTYELQGGTANVFINDDGLQILSEEERQTRIDFYYEHSIGWSARPRHGENGFIRNGKFKKASNMNYGLEISNAVESKLNTIDRPDDWTQMDEARAYERCLKEVLEENGRAWADGNIRIGDYIVLIDSDTRVPKDCLLDAVSEMERSPEVAFLQFSSGVLQVVNTYFENGITFFTNLIYTCIKHTVANGDVAPFVGHNAILRWSAIQHVSFLDEHGCEKFWSESHVSEDFDMSLRLQVNGYIIRFCTWAGDGFKEGVSLTVYDELARWEKYAYGCNELLFNPIRFWPVRGPFTPLFRSFLCSNIRFTSKVTILSYIGTYYAIGAAWIQTVGNYFAVGWFNGYLDHYYMDSWKVFVSIITVFTGLGNLALANTRYRSGERSFCGALAENIKWIPLLCIFLGGLSLHISQALLSHLFQINMTWGATSKEAQVSHFFKEVPKALRRFKFSMAFAVLGIAAMVVLARASFVPYNWRIVDFVAILPMATVTASHLLLPIVLNPALMAFSW